MDLYFKGLLSQYRQSIATRYRIASVLESDGDFLPSGSIPVEEYAKRLNLINYDDITKTDKQDRRQTIRLRYHELQGGIGTGVRRTTYMQHRKLGGVTAKGMDLSFEMPMANDKRYLSILEVRLLRLLREAKRFNEVILQYFVNPENQAALNKLLDRPNFELTNQGLPQKSYRECIEEQECLTLAPLLLQELNPTIETVSGSLSKEHLAPGGHGELGTLSLYDLATKPIHEFKDTIRVYCKGNSINESPDESIVRWMANKHIPIVMTARLRTPTDISGGIFGLEKLTNGEEALQLFEYYQAEQSGQVDEFLDNTHPQYYDTNTILVNDGILAPFLTELRKIVGDEAYRDIVTADLCQNPKKINGKEYIQLEGILGSPFLKLNRFTVGSSDERVQKLRRKYHLDRLIYLVDVSKRWAASTSVKKSFDFWLYGHTDHFQLDMQSWTLVNRKPGHTIQLGSDLLSNVYYKDLHYLIEALDGVSVVNLNYLNIRGKVKLPQAKLAGRVNIESDSDKVVDLNSLPAESGLLVDSGSLILEDVSVSIDKAGHVRVYKL